MYDVIIIGAGVSGVAIARELSKYDLKIAVLEKNLDVCEGTSKANSGISHAGYDAKPGTLKAKLNVRGTELMEQLSKDLDFPYKRNGSLILCFDEADYSKLIELKERGEANGVKGLEILSREELLGIEPEIGDAVVAALHAPSGGIVCPFGLTIALAENAADNGVDFFFNQEVSEIHKQDDFFTVITYTNQYESRMVVNAAGLYADVIHNMVSSQKITIEPRKGEYVLCDKSVGGYIKHTLFQLPTSLGKGILVTPTVHGNLLLGPTATDQEDKEGTDTSAKGLETVFEKASVSVKNVPKKEVITSFAGLRAHMPDTYDFMIEEAKDVPGFIDVAGIESPGLSCAPATGEYVAGLIINKLHPAYKENFIATREGIPTFSQLSTEEKQKLISISDTYANVICRCESITEGEILEAIHRTLGATTTDGIKRRTRAGMGRCQSGFCNPKVVEILARELKMDESEILKASIGSYHVFKDEYKREWPEGSESMRSPKGNPRVKGGCMK